MKLFIILSSFFLFSSSIYAAKIDDYIKIGQGGTKIDLNNNINKVLNDTLKSAQDDILKKIEEQIKTLQNNLDKNINDITNKFNNEIQKATDRVNNNIINKAEKLVNDATNEYNSIVATKNKFIGVAENIINNFPKYLLIFKIVLGIVFIILFSIIILFWRAYKNTKKMAGELLKFTSPDNTEILNKLNSIEAKLNSLISNK